MALKLKIRDMVRELDIAAKSFTSLAFLGNYRSAYRGKGLEFDSFRKFVTGDDSSLIDWKASVRTGDVLIKQFVEERDLSIYFLFDVSNSMLFGSGEKLKNHYGAEVIASLAYTAMSNDDRIGMGMFNEKIVKGFRLQSGEMQYYALLAALSDTKSYGGGYDLANALNFVSSFLDEGSILFIISDFIGLKKGWEEIFKLVCSRYDVISVMIRDIRDSELPTNVGDVVIKSPFSGEKVAIMPKKISKKYTQYVKKQEFDLEDSIKGAGAEFVRLDTKKDFVNPLITLFKRRELKSR